MMMVAIAAELLREYAAALTRVTERLLPPRRGVIHFHGLRNLRLSSPASNQDSSSFVLYF
ncbi:hypothetical protein I3843_06G035100 [Carya illinoinensis]|uniref:Uncharacterized protein n=1 Tax=Carya illinoinensis TaxID=32201 RepID=A0A922ET15_CARIL|nr:hypothetical protein I3842_06G039400 [Carya illinoinensis]KAG7974168.1 hypothetical protein I3843_06G035100 [Carya illinoinensis]